MYSKLTEKKINVREIHINSQRQTENKKVVFTFFFTLNIRLEQDDIIVNINDVYNIVIVCYGELFFIFNGHDSFRIHFFLFRGRNLILSITYSISSHV